VRRAWVFVAVALSVTAACGPNEDSPVVSGQAGATTTTTTIAPVTTTTTSIAVTTTAAVSKASTAVIEPDTVAGLALGANKTQVIAVLGTPTKTGQDTDLSGAKYDYLRWELDGNRGLTLNFRTPSVTSPLLTDWIATAKGPRTKSGIQVGDPASKVVTAHGALQNFCCDSKIASVKQGPGRMIIVVPNGSAVGQLIGGDEAFWSRSIAD
jgi:hypothetical protein